MRTSDPRETLKFFEERRDAIAELLRELVHCDTPTGDVAASRAFVRLYRELLEECGVRCREYETDVGVHLAGDWTSAGDASEAEEPSARPDLLIAVHSDTVWPAGEAGRWPAVLREGRLFGPGAYDMKAGLALAVFFFRFLRDGGVDTGRRFRIFVSADEEHGSVDARRFLEREAPPGICALVPEPPCPDGALKLHRKGVGIYSLEITGRASHAGTEPHLGASAVDELLLQAVELHRLRDPSRGITVNIGTVEGGTASNVVAARARATIDVRFERLEDGQRLDAVVRGLRPRVPAIDLTVVGGIVFPPMVPDARTLEEARKYIELAAGLGFDVGTGRSGGGSDGSFLTARGIVTLDGVGADGAGAHARNEHVIVDRLPIRGALLAEMALRMGGE